ncbi:MAG: membrane dipeptidase, partial [Paracoccaceae bacterium]|nr:membrane dipeptidase [Paracoccaceae bacterium]
GIGYWHEITCDTSPDAIARSISAAITLLGEDHVSLGSDFDGAVAEPFDTAELVVVTDALLRAGISADAVAKVMGGNMARFLLQALPEG